MILCAECQPLYDGWLMHEFRPRRWIQYNSLERSLESKRDQHAAHRMLVNDQLAAITNKCKRDHQ